MPSQKVGKTNLIEQINSKNNPKPKLKNDDRSKKNIGILSVQSSSKHNEEFNNNFLLRLLEACAGEKVVS
jgi:hypothetical protein